MRSSMRPGSSSTWRPIRSWYGPRAGIGSTSCKRASTRPTMNRPRLRQRRLSRYWRGGLTARFLSRSRPANNEPAGPWLELSVRDDGQGVPRTKIDQVFFAERPRVHALVLLRRRLQGLFGRSFQLEVRSEIGEGTTVTMRLPLRKRLAVGLESPRAITSELRELAYGPADGAPVWRTITAIRTKKSRSPQK